MSISIRWHYQWLFADGVSHVLFLIVLLAIVCLWAPHENSRRYAFSQQLGSSGAFPEPEGVDEEKVGALEMDGGEDDEFTDSVAAPQLIGAAGAEDDDRDSEPLR